MTNRWDEFLVRALRMWVVGWACALGVGQAPAEWTLPGSSGDFLDSLESSKFGRLYKNKEGPINEWWLHGRADLQFAYLDSDQGDADEFEMRRLRMGTSVDFLDDWRAKFVLGAQEENEVRYQGILTAYLRYRPSKQFELKLGKQVPKFTQEWSTPSMDLGLVERSLLVEQVRPKRATGLSMKGDWNDLEYGLSVFSGFTDRELGDLSAGVFWVANLAYDLAELDLFDWFKKFELSCSYLYSDGDSDNNAVRPYRHGVSTAINLRRKRFRLSGEVIYADGIMGRPDAWGFLVTPNYELLDDRLYAVARYHYAHSDRKDGLRSRRRYERSAPMLTDHGRGEEYHSFYLGLDYHLIEDRLMLQSGLEWARMKDTEDDGGDFDGLTMLSVLRFGF